jgi:hypothetical protein
VTRRAGCASPDLEAAVTISPARQRSQLLTERQVLQRNRSVSTGDESNEAEEHNQRGQHA